MQQPVVEEAEKPGLHLLEYLDLIRKHIKLILIAGVVCAGIGFALYSAKEPLYKATAKLNLYDLSSESLDFTESRNTSFMKMYFRTEILNTEFEIMKSEPVVNKVVDLLTPAYFEGNLPKPDSPQGWMGRLRAKLFGDDGERETAAPARKLDHDSLRGWLLARVRISEVPDTNLVQVSFVSRSAEVARDVANAWVDAYIKHGLERGYQAADQSRKFLQEQLDQLYQDTEALVADKNQLAQRANIVKLGENSNVDDENVARLNESLLQAETDLFKLEAELDKLNATTPAESVEVSRSERISGYERRLADKRREYDKDLKIYNPNLPAMQALKKELDAIESEMASARRQVYNDLVNELEGDIAAQRSTVSRLRGSLAERTDVSFETRSELERRIRSLEDQIDGNRKMISDLNYRLKSFDLSMDMKEIGSTDKEVIERARLPGGPFAPSLKKYVGLGLFLGLLLSAGVIFLKEITDRRVHDADSLEKLTGLPTLARVPRIQERALERTIVEFKRHALEESLMRVRELGQAFPGQPDLIEAEKLAQQTLNAGKDPKTGEIEVDLESSSNALQKLTAFCRRAGRTVEDARLADLRKLCRYASMLGVISQEMPEEGAAPVKTPPRRRARKRNVALNFVTRPKTSEDVAYGNTSDEPEFMLRPAVGCYTHLKPHSPFSEAYRHLRTNVQLSGTKRQQVFLLTSSVPGEGKTISSVNLAIAFSQLRKKTLLIDADLRRSRLHKVFKTREAPGLVDCLAGQEKLDACIRRTFVPNLDLICSGNHTPRPAELLASEEMKALIAKLRERYDFIIFDSSPVLAVTDACIVGNQTDAALFVSKAGKSTRDAVAEALQNLRNNGIEPLGVLFNDIDHSKKIGYSKYGYGYGYGRRYGYGYGAHHDAKSRGGA